MVSEGAGSSLVPAQTSGVYQQLQAEITEGEHKGEVVTAVAQQGQQTAGRTYKAGDDVVLQAIQQGSGGQQWLVADAIRRPALAWLALLFAVLVCLIGGWRGLNSLIGLCISFVVLIKLVIPMLLAGASPILVSVLGGAVILVATLYLAHGVSLKTTVALASTAVSLLLSALLGGYFVGAAQLTGASQDAFYVQIAVPDTTLNLQGLLLGGIIIGVIGILDDITVSQSAVVFALREANPLLRWRDLFWRGMSIGRDHIASLVNTLVLVYAGAALPLLLLFSTNNIPFAVAINQELVAREVVSTLVGSIGLVASVPLTTALASRVALRAGPTPHQRLNVDEP